jgi:endoglucanase
MNRGTPLLRRRLLGLVGATLLGMLAMAPASAAPAAASDDLYVPPPNREARRQIAELRAQGDKEGADLIRAMTRTPQAVWFTGGTPRSVGRDVRHTATRAAARREVPVLVAYNIPFRDCAQFSAGGATTVAEYEAWIDAFAEGIGNRRAIVVLEPDGLGIIPWYDPYGSADGSNALEWCQPAEANPATAASERFAMLRYAVGALAALRNATVYLDGTHSAWLGNGDIAHRLSQAGVAEADGFFLNVSNYQFTANLVQYGRWTSSCLAYAIEVVPGDFFNCPNQYWNGGPPPAKIADLLGPWTGVALSSFGEWSDESDDPALNTSGINLRYDTMLGGVEPAAQFVIDTSRNGLGPWQPPPGAYPDPQDWCNPPDRGLGLAPTLEHGEPLVDALLWVKIPGESDGECTRGLGPAGETVDPEWGIIDPAPGDWFPEMALDLAWNAEPPLRP